MRRLILAGVALAALAPLAFAQSQAPAPAGAAPQVRMAQADDMPPPPPPPGGGKHGRKGPGGWGMMPPPPPPPRGPHIRLERGDTALDVNCGEAETLRSCADIANQMLDKLAGMPVGAMPAPPPSPPAGAPPAATPTTPTAPPPAPAN